MGLPGTHPHSRPLLIRLRGPKSTPPTPAPHAGTGRRYNGLITAIWRGWAWGPFAARNVSGLFAGWPPGSWMTPARQRRLDFVRIPHGNQLRSVLQDRVSDGCAASDGPPSRNPSSTKSPHAIRYHVSLPCATSPPTGHHRRLRRLLRGRMPASTSSFPGHRRRRK